MTGLGSKFNLGYKNGKDARTERKRIIGGE
jgi:hypothetical protein